MTDNIETALHDVLNRQKPRLANQDDTGALGQMIRIYGVQILAHLIQLQNPSLPLALCKTQAIEEMYAAISQDWQV